MTPVRKALSLTGAGILICTLAACGGDDGGKSGNANPDNSNAPSDAGTSASWILGTTDPVVSIDPAGAYDIGSWNLQYSIFEQLLVIPAGGDQPEADAAESCDYDDPQTVTCKLRADNKFSNGNALTSSDVKFSFERNIKIADPNGASSLLGSLTESKGDAAPTLVDGAIETPDDTTVVFHLTKPDQTFVKVLTTAAASIVDEETFPADKLMDSAKVIGSGPYTLSDYKVEQQAALTANTEYTGTRSGKANQVIVKLYKEPSALRSDIGTSKVDVAWRTLSAVDLADLGKTDGLSVLNGDGSEFRYWVFNTATATGKQLPVRQAIASIIDRAEITQDVYDGTTTPAYSLVPPGFAGQKESFKEVYGDAPDLDAAKKFLSDAGVKTPVKLNLGVPPDKYGDAAVQETNTFADQLKASGLFDVTVVSDPYEEYKENYREGAYDLYMLGWYPDFLDADNYLSPFLRDGGFFANGYSNDEVNSLLDDELGATDEAARADAFGKIQDITAKDVPVLPSWNGKNSAVATSQMDGVEETLDPTYIFRIWDVTKKQ
ncbi:ABC transporter substrate-binding protein [Nocardioides plantarum]|uniref:ABC transporter substrate-binding protein n=1 Tax=Nocardioides plantarum TaxID=29299 RepID=A0ABV5KDE2_9ACTN|nr:ABC transporter substrate-binding protein [Nocardioides plantarum]